MVDDTLLLFFVICAFVAGAVTGCIYKEEDWASDCLAVGKHTQNATAYDCVRTERLFPKPLKKEIKE